LYCIALDHLEYQILVLVMLEHHILLITSSSVCLFLLDIIMLWCCFFKPGNIFVNHDLSQVQVGDFGLACCLQHSSEDVTLMVQPSTEHPLKHKGEVGTKLYAAPEQLRGKCDSKVSELFCMLENKMPYEVGYHETAQGVTYNLLS